MRTTGRRERRRGGEPRRRSDGHDEPGRPESDDELVAYSRGLIERVSAHADAFVAEGLPPDLLKHLEDGIAAFVAAREAQAVARQRFGAASQVIRETLDRADKTVDVLETIARAGLGSRGAAEVPHRPAGRSARDRAAENSAVDADW